MFAFFALVLYTNETRRQRKISEDQLEAGLRPIVLFEIHSGDYVPGQRLNLNAQFRNIGPAPGFNVTVDPIKGDGVCLNIECVPLIASNGEIPSVVSTTQIGADQPGGMSLMPALLDEQFSNGKFQDRTPVIVRCRGLSGKLYRFFLLIRIDPPVKVWTEFDRTEPM